MVVISNSMVSTLLGGGWKGLQQCRVSECKDRETEYRAITENDQVGRRAHPGVPNGG